MMKSIFQYLRDMGAPTNEHYERHLVQCFTGGEIGESEGREVGYLLMEYIDGSDLERYVKTNGPMDVKEALDAGIAIAKVLTAAHRYNIIHRDIKPRNVLRTKEGIVKVGDLGLVKRTMDFLVEREEMVGTLPYMAPEVLDLSKRSQAGQNKKDNAEEMKTRDVYSLGATLYFLLTKEVPRAYDSMEDAMHGRTHSVRKLSELRTDIPAAVETVVMGLMSRENEKRPKAHQALGALETLRIVL